jgi:hypothetical protein
LNPSLQLAAEKKDSKNGAARKIFWPSYFDLTLVNQPERKLAKRTPV